MSRFFGIVTDPTAGGSTYDKLAGLNGETAIAIPAPTIYVPVTTGDADPGINPINRDNEVRGRRSNTPPLPFQADPSMTFESRAYPKIANQVVRKALGGSIATTGTGPAAIVSTIQVLQSGNLPAVFGWLQREEQLDRLCGGIVSEFTLNLPIEGEATLATTLSGLYLDDDKTSTAKDPKTTSALETAPAYEGFEYAFMLRDVVAKMGPKTSELVELSNLAGVSLTYNNGMITTPVSRFRPNHNIESAEIGTSKKKLWWPNKHKIGAQNITGTINFSEVDTTREQRRILSHAEALTLELVAGPLATTPANTEIMKITLYSTVLTGGGGADPIVREGDQVSSYNFGAYLDPAENKDVEVAVTAAAALT